MPTVAHRSGSESESDIFYNIDTGDKFHYVMTAGCHNQFDGLVTGHAYSVLGAAELDGEKLIKMRNPWGNEKYTGPYHDGDSVWTDSKK